MITKNNFATLKAREEDVIFNSYARYPIAIEKALGTRLYDFEGKEYIDLLSGIAVVSVGHCHPEIAEAIYKQANKLVHVSNMFYQEEQLELAETLLRTTEGRMGKVFFCNSGAEANEAAIKLARRYQQKVCKKDAYEVISLTGCFHGRTLATVAATGQAKFQDGFQPMPEGFSQIPVGDIQALKAAVSSKTAAIILEVIQGEGGVKPIAEDFLKAVMELKKAHDILLIVDEVQTGLCRTGKWWGFQNFLHTGIEPDIITSAKALANGLPMGAMMAKKELGAGFAPGSHASTFGGNALVSAAALSVLRIMERDKIAEHVAKTGDWAKKRFSQIASKHPGTIVDVRGMGMLLGIELSVDAKEVWNKLVQKGFIMNLTQEKILRIIPPLTITENELELFALALESILSEM